MVLPRTSVGSERGQFGRPFAKRPLHRRRISIHNPAPIAVRREDVVAQFANLTEGLRFRIVLRPGVALGPGKADLLQAIDETQSLTAAAARFGMSYKRGWMLVQELNTVFAKPLVETAKGGSGGGGGAQLTGLGRRILRRYREMEADANKVVEAGIADLRKHLAEPAATRRTK
jgi:molybdate transport system regulatory protein